MTAKNIPYVIKKAGKTSDLKRIEGQMFIGEWSQADTDKLCNPKPEKAKKLKIDRERKKK